MRWYTLVFWQAWWEWEKCCSKQIIAVKTTWCRIPPNHRKNEREKTTFIGQMQCLEFFEKLAAVGFQVFLTKCQPLEIMRNGHPILSRKTQGKSLNWNTSWAIFFPTKTDKTNSSPCHMKNWLGKTIRNRWRHLPKSKMNATVEMTTEGNDNNYGPFAEDLQEYLLL